MPCLRPAFDGVVQEIISKLSFNANGLIANKQSHANTADKDGTNIF